MIDSFLRKEKLLDLFNEKISNQKSKGIDKKNSHSFKLKLNEELDLIVEKIESETYKFSPYLEVLKSKGRNELPRVISIPTVRDRIVLLALKEILHEKFPDCVNRKLPNKFINDIKKYIESENGEIHYLKVDIKKFYDKIDRPILLKMIRKRNVDESIITLISQAIENPTIPLNSKKESYNKYKTTKGVPQGLSISNILAQIYLAELDKALDEKKFYYSRYVDDILILNKGPVSAFSIKSIKSRIAKIKLSLNKDKTQIGSLSEGVTFLGYHLKTNKISIAEKNVELFIRRIAGKFTWFKNSLNDPNKRPKWIDSNERLKEIFIEELNDSLTGVISQSKNYGWLFYFSEMNDLNLLFRLDKIISSFFNNLDIFDNSRPQEIKSLVRAYYAIIYRSNISYINNLDSHNTVNKKRNYLIFRGKLNPDIAYSDIEIANIYKNFIERKIRYLERDIGYKYF